MYEWYTYSVVSCHFVCVVVVTLHQKIQLRIRIAISSNIHNQCNLGVHYIIAICLFTHPDDRLLFCLRRCHSCIVIVARPPHLWLN